jgi:hypothetical protein
MWGIAFAMTSTQPPTSSWKMHAPESVESAEVFDSVLPNIPQKSAKKVDREIADLRRARRTGGRRSTSNVRDFADIPGLDVSRPQ